MLQLTCLGVEPDGLPWVDPPADSAVAQATDLLEGLGAIDETGRLTQIGMKMARLPMHPRLSRLLVEAATRRCLERAALWAALISERNIRLRPGRSTIEDGGQLTSDLEELEQRFTTARGQNFDALACERSGVAANSAREVDSTCHLYLDRARGAGLPSSTGGSTADLIKCLLVSFFDRVAARRGSDAGRDNLHRAMAGQKRVELDPASVARDCDLVVAVEIGELESFARPRTSGSNRAGGESAVRTVLSMASGVDPEWLVEVHPHRVQHATETVWNREDRAAESHHLHRYDGLVFRRIALPDIDPAEAESMLVDRFELGEIWLDRWDEEVEEWINRTRLLARLFPERDLILYDEEDLHLLRHEIAAGATRASHVRKRACLPHVENALSWSDQEFVRRMAPTRLSLPSGHRMTVRYFAAQPPRGRARIQDLYGLSQSPTIAAGRQKLLLEILGPNFRPVQVTDDLSGFWRTTYPEVKKELKRRYPKHEWR